MSKITMLVITLVAFSLTLANANPMQPDNYRKPAVSTTKKVSAAPKLPTLTNILIIGDYQLATFNDKTELTLGETISGYQLVEIQPTYVVVLQNNKQTKLELKTTGALAITPAKEE